MNTTKIVYISDVVADANGELLIDFSTTAAAQWGFNAGIIVMDYSDVNGASTLYMSNSMIDSTSPSIAVLADDYRVKIYPNPFNDVMNIDFINPSESNKVTAEVYDLTGRLIFRKDYNRIPAGRNVLRISGIGSEKTSIYIVALKINGKICKSIKMIKR